MTVRQIVDIIESVAPLSSQEVWDNSGLQVGSYDAQVRRVLLCTDVSEAVLEEAIRRDCGLVISHHPLLFHGLKTIQKKTWQERCVVMAIKHEINIYSSHTSMDNYSRGVSGRMAERMGIRDYTILAKSADEIGLGVIGDLEKPISKQMLLSLVKDAFRAPVIRYTDGGIVKMVQRVALCGGAGSEFVDEAIRQGAEAYISADFRYHEFQQVCDSIMVMDIGHFESEQFTKEIFGELIAKNTDEIECFYAEEDASCVRVYKE